MTRRLPHGGTTRPPLSRPGNGFGRVPRVGPSPRQREVALATRRPDPSVLVAIDLRDEALA